MPLRTVPLGVLSQGVADKNGLHRGGFDPDRRRLSAQNEAL